MEGLAPYSQLIQYIYINSLDKLKTLDLRIRFLTLKNAKITFPHF